MWYNVPKPHAYSFEKEMIPIAQGRFSSPRGRAPQPADDFSGLDRRDAYDRRRRNRRIVLISLCSVALVLLIAAGGCLWYFYGGSPDDGRILHNITVAGMDLGGMTPEEAKTALHAMTDNTYEKTDMAIELPDTILLLSPKDTGAKLDIDAVVAEAYAYGRTGNRSEKKAEQEALLTGEHLIALLPYLTLDKDFIRKTLEQYGAGYNSTYVPSSVTVEGEMPILDTADERFAEDAVPQTLTLTLGMPGRHVDMEKVYNQVLDAYSFNNMVVTVIPEEAEKLPETIDLQALYDEYFRPAADAVMDMQTFEVSHEKFGYDFDLEAAAAQLSDAVYGDTLTIPLRMTEPAVRKEALDAVLFRDELGSFETEHTKNENRNNNLRLACEAINGLVLQPGDTFDYNKVVGKRTAERGYKEADAYSSGQTVKTLGGGICQVSSTLYYCVLVADLEVVTRKPHSFVSSYMPMGMDATVSWGGPEFRFKNSTNYPIRIEAEVSGGYVKVKLIGTDEKDYYIKMEYEVTATQNPTTVTETMTAEEAAKKGYRDGQVIQTAYKGYTVNTYKVKYDKETGELISRDFDRTSKYKKRDKIVVSIKKETPPPTDPPAEEPT